MKNLKFYKVVILSLIISLTLSSCNSDDDLDTREIPLFTEADLSTIHGDSEKSWKITEVINFWYDRNYDLEIELSCLQDDIYTFSSIDNSFSVDLGEEKCFGSDDDEEIFDGELILMDSFKGETIYLRYSRGYGNNNGGISTGGVSIRYYALAELSENRMVFYREHLNNQGEYLDALIFEKI